MNQCCVFGCKNKGNHSFPKDKKIRKRWEYATRCKNFKAKSYTKICADHFRPEDFTKIGYYSGLTLTRRVLKKGVVPSIFKWSNKETPPQLKQRQERAAKRQANRKIVAMKNEDENCERRPSTSSETTVSVDISDGEIEVIKEESDTVNPPRPPKVVQYVNEVECSTQKNYQFYTVESFRNDDKAIWFYTGLESFKKFMFVFKTLCPDAYSLKNLRKQAQNLSAEDQFLLTLMKLRRNKDNFELGLFFNISQHTVSNIFTTWINFMHQMWEKLDVSPSRDVINLYMPERLKHPTTRVDCTEPIERPGNPAAQRVSSYKNHSNIEFEAEETPSGMISHCSKVSEASSRDKEIVEQSEPLHKSDPGNSIKADHGFYTKDITAHTGVAINKPTFLRGKNQLPGKTAINDRKVALKRIKRLIGLTKTYQIFNHPVNTKYASIMSKMYFVCIMLCHFRESILIQSA